MIDGIVIEGTTIVISPSLQKEMLQLIHVGHMGIGKIRERAKDIIVWPGMSKDIANLVSKSHICVENRNSNQKEPRNAPEIPNRPWAIITTVLVHWMGQIS